MQPPEIHLLLTGDQDIVLFVKQTKALVLIHNAERSMGLKWKDGIYSVDDARRLWSDIQDYGGRVISHDINTIVAGLFKDSITAVKMQADQEFVDSITAVKRQADQKIAEKESEIRDLYHKNKSLLAAVSRLSEDMLGVEASAYEYTKVDSYGETKFTPFRNPKVI